ncbi:hypothetical protein SAMN05428974_3325 [Sphingopyxis sp. YR583]|jgi:hypothetical protein|uniref:hypothetical protein n=1 Tax=Sphingopyxis sp. YR583 TaxID=1881047 RepID=UPI0008A7842E|nr:hypothetical protein [Sphingopyxis sp. YR583]SEH19265.1 hypothetical protein SAMN05428974_3325 [Sphingopyxis sp. YR583]
MKMLYFAALIAAASVPIAAEAKVPFFNATCPGKIDVHADEGGPVYLNGKEAKLKISNPNYFEATLNKVTISVSKNPDGSLSVSYTGPKRANGICQVKGG